MASPSFRTSVSRPSPCPLLRPLVMLAVALLTGCASLPPGTQRDQRDPFERVNRAMYNLDDHMVRKVARPVNTAWRHVTPAFLRRAFANVFENARTPDVMLNDLLQGKFNAAGNAFARLAINSTFGLGGLIDAASWGRVPKHSNDFGRTLGVWGVPAGPYLVLPFYGPSTVRDALGSIPDSLANPQNYLNTNVVIYSLYSLDMLTVIDQVVIPTYALLDQQHPFDPYGFARSAYLQRRDFLIHGEQSQDDLLRQMLQEDAEDADAGE